MVTWNTLFSFAAGTNELLRTLQKNINFKIQKLTTMILRSALLLFILGSVNPFSIYGQVAISTNGTTPHPSAMLEVNSTAKGLLIPRSSFSTISNINNARGGLLMYDTTNQQFMFNAGGLGQWRSVVDSRSWQRSLTTGREVVYTTDSVGIGTSNPSARLHLSSFVDNEMIRLSGLNPQISFYGGGLSSTSKGFINVTGDDAKWGTVAGNSLGKAIIRVNGGDRVSVTPEGNVGIATVDPEARLHIAGGQDAGLTATTNGFIMLGSATGSNIILDNNEIMCRNGTAASTLALQNDGGTVRVGSVPVPDGYLFAVAGKAICTELRVQLTNAWPDYVFEDNYRKPGLDELRTFIAKNRHLPNIPPAAEVEKNGIELGDMQRRLTEKVEELTLYILELESRIKKLEQR